jgi:hypothetical protein
MKTPMLAELDPVQIAIVVIAMLGGFFQWLWSLIQQGKKEAEERRDAPIDPEEKKRREEAWRRQTQGTGAPRPAPPPLKPAMDDPFSTVKEIFEQIKREAMEAQRPPKPAAPPTLPPSRPRPPKRHSVRSDLSTPDVTHPEKRPSVAVELQNLQDSPPVTLPISQAASTPVVLPAWTGLLSSPTALRQAFILREILGPPKALQSSGDSPI